MEFLHNDTDERLLTLHDCRADQAMIDGGVLSFIFSDGIRIAPNHTQNPTGEVVRTGVARVDFPLLTGAQDQWNVRDEWEDVTIYVFRKLWFGVTIRQEWSLFKMLHYLNRRKGELEFISRFDGYMERIYECCLWQKKRPYHRDCQLKITTKPPVYRWNEIREEREW